MGHCYYFGAAFGLAALMGCGNPTENGQVSGNNTGSGEAIITSPTGETERFSWAA